MLRAKWAVAACLVIQATAGGAIARDLTASPKVLSVRTAVKRLEMGSAHPGRRQAITTLDRVAFAVDGAESSHGQDLAMWRADWSGPQGPMQLSEAAAIDVGGGDRFDVVENRKMGRYYLGQLYRRYRDWPDAVAAYNWGLSHVDSWIKAGRPSEKLAAGVATYTMRVLRDSGLCGGDAMAVPFTRFLFAGFDADGNALDSDRRYDCANFRGAFFATGPLRAKRVPGPPPSLFEQQVAAARSSWIVTSRRLGCAAEINGSLSCK